MRDLLALLRHSPSFVERYVNWMPAIDGGGPDCSHDTALAVHFAGGFQGVAATTISTNQRNYLLGIIREERGEIDFTRDLAALNRQTFARFTNYDLLRRLKYRFRAEDADDVNLSAIVAVDNEAFLLSVQNNVLRIDTPMPENVGDAALSLSREDLLDVVTRVQGLSDIAGWDQGEAAMLAGLIE